MRIEYDPAKREEPLARRGIDMADAAEVFAGPCITAEDGRFDYGEPRFLTIGLLRQRLMIVAWTHRGESCRITSMRKANDREIARYAAALRNVDG